MSQSKLQSFAESVTNIIVGYTIAVLTQLFVFPLFGIQTTISDNLLIGLCFTIVSLIRSYVLRRLFNKQQDTNE